jgi:hypothetical protein
MATEREIDEMVARCVSSLVYYVKDSQSLEATRMVEYEIDRIAHWLSREGLNADVDGLIRAPVVEELTSRFGRFASRKLSARFLRPLGCKVGASVSAVGVVVHA